MKTIIVTITFITLLINFSEAKNMGPSFSCRYKYNLSRVEKLICRSDALSDVDLQLNIAYTKASATLNLDKKKQIVKDQRAWLKTLAQCTNHDCIHTSMMTRLTEIDRLIK
ncbi:MAG: hypothetical protein B7Y39_17425 [Bdellovibrio sp. 28-41-41]|nr:MAG: hypothetical protein B7Y39_17425 [Bdellovibrio sp. 28-41-41]